MYVSGFVAAVPTARKDDYRESVRRSWQTLRSHGAREMVEAWGDDVPEGEVTDFRRAVQARAEETVVFSWIVWPDRETADAAFARMMEDPEMAAQMAEMPFDGKRMIWGGFVPLVVEGRGA